MNLVNSNKLIFTESTINTSILLNHSEYKINNYRKVLVIIIAIAGSIILLLIIITLVNCSRPSRVHKQILIEYLAPNEMINYLDESFTSSRQ